MRDREYSIAIFDVDFFKAFNDTYGHQAGDVALCAVADALLGQCRGGDGAYRFGGEEFVVILAEQGPAGAMAAAERMRAAIEARQIPHVHGAGCRVLTVSAGTASAATRDGLSPEELLRLADGALYDAKASGRNRVVAAAGV